MNVTATIVIMGLAILVLIGYSIWAYDVNKDMEEQMDDLEEHNEALAAQNASLRTGVRFTALRRVPSAPTPGRRWYGVVHLAGDAPCGEIGALISQIPDPDNQFVTPLMRQLNGAEWIHVNPAVCGNCSRHMHLRTSDVTDWTGPEPLI